MNIFALARAWLAGIDPAAPAAALVAFVFLVIYAIRRWKPTWWLWVEKTVPIVDKFDYTAVGNIIWQSWQAIPAMLLGAATSAIADGVSLKAALTGAGLGALTAVIHKLANAYKGGVGTPRPPGSSSGGGALLMLALVLCTSGCGVFGAQGSAWPAVATCAPSRGAVIDDVTDELLRGGNYKKGLTSLAERYGASTVVCVVNELVADWGAPGKAGASPELSAAKLRGEAFLAGTGTKVEPAAQ